MIYCLNCWMFFLCLYISFIVSYILLNIHRYSCNTWCNPLKPWLGYINTETLERWLSCLINLSLLDYSVIFLHIYIYIYIYIYILLKGMKKGLANCPKTIVSRLVQSIFDRSLFVASSNFVGASTNRSSSKIGDH